jgi:hypothetical protein
LSHKKWAFFEKTFRKIYAGIVGIVIRLQKRIFFIKNGILGKNSHFLLIYGEKGTRTKPPPSPAVGLVRGFLCEFWEKYNMLNT